MPERSNPVVPPAAFDPARVVIINPHAPGSAVSAVDRAPLAAHHHHDESGWLDSGLAVLDSDGTIVELNDQLCAWLDAPGEHCEGKSFWDLLRKRCGDAAA